MKKIALIGLIVAFAGLALAPLAEAGGRRHSHRHHHHRGFHSRVIIGFGPAFYYPPPYVYYPAPAVVYSPPPVVVQEPPVYVQQTPPPAAAPAPAPEVYWYYCQSANGYYPTVPSCPEAWVKVPPRP